MASGGIMITDEERAYRQNFQRGLPRDGIIERPLNCTVCNINIKHRLVTRLNVHNFLGVLLCNTCSHKIRVKGNLPDLKNKCRWCRSINNTINLVACIRCPEKYCSKCILKNSRKRTRTEEWICFTCRPTDELWLLRALCDASLTYSDNLRRELEERRQAVNHRIPRSTSTSTVSRSLNNIRNSPRRLMTSFSLPGQVPVAAISSPSRERATTTRTFHSPSSLSISVTGNVSVSLNSEPVTWNLPSGSASLRSAVASTKQRTKIFSPENGNDDMNTCVICLDEKPQIACIPCGHLCLCENCLPAFKRNFSTCAICRQFYSDTLKIFSTRI